MVASQRSAVKPLHVALGAVCALTAILCAVNYARNGSDAWFSILATVVGVGLVFLPRLNSALIAAMWNLRASDLDTEVTTREYYVRYRGMSLEEATRRTRLGQDVARTVCAVCACVYQLYFIVTDGHPSPALASGVAIAGVAFLVVLMLGVTVAGLVWAFRARA